MLVVIGIIALLIGILLPGLNVARQEAKRVQCLSNLRQLGTLATLYVNDNRGLYPVAQWAGGTASLYVEENWDYSTLYYPTPPKRIVPGLLYAGRGPTAIQQCPAYEGPSNTPGDPFTGYNYNTSYIGHGLNENVEAPMKAVNVPHPAEVALFGDGQYADGANKYMRSPLPGGGDEKMIPLTRAAGTQGFRHRLMTNVVYCDGHAASQRERFTNIDGGATSVDARCGFLSSDNHAYGQP